MWSESSPHTIHPEKVQVRWFVNMRIGRLGSRMIGPYLLPERLKGQSYLVFLRNVLTDFIDDIPLVTTHGLCFQNDADWRISTLIYVNGWIWNTQAAELDVVVLFCGRRDRKT